MSTRTIVRDQIATQFLVLKETAAGRVAEFDISLRWLNMDETKRASTYCIVVTDEQRNASTLLHDEYELRGVVVLYAYDTTDARAHLDLMIEDTLDVLRRAFRLIQTENIFRALIESITVSEASTAEDAWPQAVVRWTAIHHRAVLV
jgi:hypothetical protein